MYFGIVVWSFDEVILRRARLVLGLVTIFTRMYHLGIYNQQRSTQIGVSHSIALIE